jgi:excinuclease UvrABC nuclease subunit
MPQPAPEQAEVFNNERIACVYFLTDERGHVVYVGKSNDLHMRLRSHEATRSGLWFGVRFIRYPKDELGIWEAVWIGKLNPRMNVLLVKKEAVT